MERWRETIRRILSFILASTGAALLLTSPALAFNTRITVYASVDQMRVIYVDKSGSIVKVAGNTTENITPQIYDENNQPVAMTDSINSQYEWFLKSHDYHLQASKWYFINPVTVNNQPDTQAIVVNSSSAKLSLLL